MKTIEKQIRRFLAKLPPELETVAKGLISYIPGIMKYSDVTHSIGAQYCYSTYLAHLNQAHKVGLDPFPRVIAEIGPGTSFGAGLAALLCGSDVYYAIDELPHADLQANLQVMDETIDFLRSRTDPTEVRGTRGTLDHFPDHILTDELLERTLAESRVTKIRQALIRSLTPGVNYPEEDIKIVYLCPFTGSALLPEESLDMLMSTVVMQVVEHLPETYSCFAQWLKPGAWMSHFIDFSNYGMTRDWNGHWACSKTLWRMMQGNRPYLHNREPHSSHIRLIRDNGFEIVTDLKTYNHEGIGREKLAPEFEFLKDDDLIISRSLVQAVKVGSNA